MDIVEAVRKESKYELQIKSLRKIYEGNFIL